MKPTVNFPFGVRTIPRHVKAGKWVKSSREANSQSTVSLTRTHLTGSWRGAPSTHENCAKRAIINIFLSIHDWSITSNHAEKEQKICTSLLKQHVQQKSVWGSLAGVRTNKATDQSEAPTKRPQEKQSSNTSDRREVTSVWVLKCCMSITTWQIYSVHLTSRTEL